MAETRNIGNVGYWHHAWYPDRSHPRVAFEPTTEIDAPFRVGRSVVLRLPSSRRALVIGVWRSALQNEDEAILRATGGRVVREASVLKPGEDLIPKDE